MHTQCSFFDLPFLNLIVPCLINLQYCLRLKCRCTLLSLLILSLMLIWCILRCCCCCTILPALVPSVLSFYSSSSRAAFTAAAASASRLRLPVSPVPLPFRTIPLSWGYRKFVPRSLYHVSCTFLYSISRRAKLPTPRPMTASVFSHLFNRDNHQIIDITPFLMVERINNLFQDFILNQT